MKFTALLGDPEIVARVAHHSLAALAVSAMAIAWYGVRRGGDALRAVAWGSRIATVAVLGQLFTGLWLVMAIPAASRYMLSGDDPTATGLFACSLLATFFVLPRLATAAFGHVEPRPTVYTILLVLAVVVLMTATRHRTRALLLSSMAPDTRAAGINSGSP